LHIIETTEPIQTKFCTVTETIKIHFVGGPNRRTTNPRWQMGREYINCNSWSIWPKI